MRNALWAVLLFSALAGCVEPEAEDTQKPAFRLDRLTGKWEAVNNDSKTYEEWIQMDENHLVGKGFVMTGKDTVFIENMEIRKENSNVFYVVRLSGHQSTEPVKFRMTSYNENDVVFENPDHDFPKKIVYRIISNTEMQVFLDGIENGNFGEERFSFVRTH